MSARTAVVIISAALLVPGATLTGAQPGAAQPRAATASVAAPAWGPVVTLGKKPLDAALVVDKKGVVTAVWEAVTHPRSIVARQHRPGHAWSKATTIGHGFEPVAAVDGKGVVTVVWRGVRKGFSDGVLAARHPAKGRWSKPVRISHDVKIAGYPTDGDDVVGAVNLAVAVGPVTGVVATWEWGSDNRPFPFRIQAAVLPPGGHWKAPFAVTPPNWSRHPNVAVAGDGTTYVTFLGNADGGTRWPLKVRQRSPHGAWSTTKTLAPASAPSLMQVAANRAGDVVVGFVDGSDELSAVSRPRHAAWNAPERVDAGVSFWDYSMAILDSGAVVAALERGGGGILFTRRAPAGGWSTPAVLDTGLSRPGPPGRQPGRRRPGLLGHLDAVRPLPRPRRQLDASLHGVSAPQRAGGLPRRRRTQRGRRSALGPRGCHAPGAPDGFLTD